MEVVVMDSYVGNDMVGMDDVYYMDGMDGMMEGTEVSKTDELLSSWVFVGGVTVGVLVIGVLLGLLSAKRKIKKGIDLYED